MSLELAPGLGRGSRSPRATPDSLGVPRASRLYDLGPRAHRVAEIRVAQVIIMEKHRAAFDQMDKIKILGGQGLVSVHYKSGS